MPKKTLTFALMDPPYESANLTTAFRILDAAARRGHDINLFAYEGASALAFILTIILLIITVGYVRASVRQGALQ